MNRSADDPALLSPDASGRGAAPGGDVLGPQTYYDAPLLKRPRWGWEVTTYLFLGGVMGGSGMLLALAKPDEDRALARNARYVAFVLSAVSPAILISHLGRPERFLHMLRVVKLKSPMSLGVWGLLAFSGPAAVAALGQAARDGFVPRWLAALAPRSLTNAAQALLGAFIAGYTGVLLSATAIPLWAKGKRHIPAASVCSGVAGACALHAALLAIRGEAPRTRRKLERLELCASLAELAILLDFRRHAGSLASPMFEGERGRRFSDVTLVRGIALPALLNLLPIHNRWKTLASSVLTLAGGYVFRETLIEAGKASADEPRAAWRQPE